MLKLRGLGGGFQLSLPIEVLVADDRSRLSREIQRRWLSEAAQASSGYNFYRGKYLAAVGRRAGEIARSTGRCASSTASRASNLSAS
ncbi:MAG: hypothetical protein NZ610_00095 [Candidatus Bipolaricaulota bacterium]|nr:hypothetical protein [Candidatus Bipolaricaulota bacterium]MCS7273799.1 hypothetical protein [Candidatus Bipolaricaulota bacterium]MDW8111128.1 hypothetical protein [Candidatus Bipolaricaulota bacterium]MDW8329758.1 hypothetical protein [Candidatus Bipolaricaulota bacterium]